MTRRGAGGRTALVTGIAGQDGSYLAELLLEKGYRVVGIRRPRPEGVSRPSDDRIAHLLDRLEVIDADVGEPEDVRAVLRDVGPTEVYNLAGHSFVPTSWERPEQVYEATGAGVVRLIDAIREITPEARFYQASTSEIFGNADETPQSETTPLRPRNPYGEAKALAHAAVGMARERHGQYCVAGILYNHESPRRGHEFVSRKVTDGAARIFLGLADSLPMGGLDARRDWGFAGDYVGCMWLMLQAARPADYVVASGVTHTVRDLCRIAFAQVGLDYERYVRVDPALVRAPDHVTLVGDASKARRELRWAPRVSFQALIEMMVDADVARLRKETIGPSSEA